MSKVTTLIYGSLLIAIVIATWTGVFPDTLLPIAVIAMGALILFTPMVSARGVLAGQIRPRFQWIRQYVFGAYLVLSGLNSFVDILSNFPWMARTSIYTFSGQLIILGIGAIYFLAAFSKTRQINVASY
jgi:hypothetical protein